MLSRDANYNMDNAINEIEDKKRILETKVDTQVILQIMVQKGIVTREEISNMRETVLNSPKYKATNEYLKQAEQQAVYYKQHPEEHLRELFKAKMNGDIT